MNKMNGFYPSLLYRKLKKKNVWAGITVKCLNMYFLIGILIKKNYRKV